MRHSRGTGQIAQASQLTWLTSSLLGLLVVVVIAVVSGTWHLIQRDRRELAEQFSHERLVHIEAINRRVEQRVQSVADDLTFAAQLVRGSATDDERKRVLGAMLGAVKPYCAAGIYNLAGGAVALVSDPLGDEVLTEDLRRAMASAAAAVLATTDDRIETSTALNSDPQRWYRAFALNLEPSGKGQAAGAIVLLVDLRELLAVLRLVSTEPRLDLLVLGPRGRPIPISSDPLVSALEQVERGERPGTELERIVHRMRTGETGTDRVGIETAVALGFEPAEVIAAFGPVAMPHGAHWSIATFTSTSLIRAHEKALISRMVLIASAVLVALLLFNIYALVATRRQAFLRERLRNADQIADLNEKAQKILDSIPTGVLVLAADGRVTNMNHALRQKLGHADPGADLVHTFPAATPATIGHIRTVLDRAAASGETKSMLGERLALFSGEGQYNIHAVPLESRSSDARALVVIEDLTEIRSLESQLVHSEKLATVGMLAAGIAHEVGTPLGVIRGRAEYISSKLGSDHTQSAGLSVIIDQIDRIKYTIQTLLDYSRFRPATVTQVELAPVVSRVIELLRFETNRRKLTVNLAVDEGVAPLAADADQLQQVLVNLLMNAYDACAPGGQVGIAATADRTEDAPAWEHVRIVIADDGCGIPHENINHVFDPFFTTKKRGQGTGLGLSIVSQIVRNHGGRIDLASEPGHGTQLTVFWPTGPHVAEHTDGA